MDEFEVNESQYDVLEEELEQMQAMADELKPIYGDIYHTYVGDEHFLCRILSRKEYKSIYYADLDPLEFQEAIASMGTVYPEGYNFSEGAAGVAEVICDLVMQVSYLKEGQAKEVLNAFREEMNVFDNQADCLIHEAFPEYRLDEIEDFTVEQTLYYLSRAEYILNAFRGIQIVHVGQEEQQEERAEAPIPQKPQQQAPPRGAANGGGEITSFEQMKNMPELRWFQGENELTGDFE